jgi:hypothetical protein
MNTVYQKQKNHNVKLDSLTKEKRKGYDLWF